MILILGLTLWAFEARILRGQALTLRNRDFILAAKVAGEPTWRIVLFELMPNMISRIAAAFVLVFYVSILTAAGLEFLGLGDLSSQSWGVTLYWAQVNSTVLQGEWWPFLFPGLFAGAHGRGARADPRRPRRGLATRACASRASSAACSPACSSDTGAAGERRGHQGAARARPSLGRLRPGRPPRARGRRRLALDRPGRDPRAGRRVGLRQEHARERRAPDPQAAGGGLGRAHPLPGLRSRRHGPRRSCAACAGATSRSSSRAR